MFTVNGTEQHNDMNVKPLYSVQATLIVSLGPFQTSCYCPAELNQALAKWSRVHLNIIC